MTEYRVALDVYNGPLDLLLFLIRREEVDIYDIPIAYITDQYLQYVELLKELDPEVIGDFLVLAATLMEIKSRSLLPRPPAIEDDEDLADPRIELVRQLLEYKRFKDAAHELGEAAEERARQHARVPVLPPAPDDETELDNLEVWDLFEAFQRLLEQTGKTGAFHQVGVDDTPITLHAEDILDSLERTGGRQEFEEIFLGRNRAEMIGLFLALLELIRQHRVRVVQESPTAPISVTLLDRRPLDYSAFAGNESADIDGIGQSPTPITADTSTDAETEAEHEMAMVGSATNPELGGARDASDSLADESADAAPGPPMPEGEAKESVDSASPQTAGDARPTSVPADEILSSAARQMANMTDPMPSLAGGESETPKLAAPAGAAAKTSSPPSNQSTEDWTKGSSESRDVVAIDKSGGEHPIERTDECERSTVQVPDSESTVPRSDGSTSHRQEQTDDTE